MEQSIGYPKPPPKEKEKDPRSFREKYATPIKRKPYNLKRTPLKHSKKQLANLAKYESGKREKYENTPGVCPSCGRNDRGISCSHLVARSHSFDMVSLPANNSKACFVCHDLIERGQFFVLKNGLELLNRLWNDLGEKGRERFWKVWHQWPQNADLFIAGSVFYDPEIHC